VLLPRGGQCALLHGGRCVLRRRFLRDGGGGTVYSGGEIRTVGGFLCLLWLWLLGVALPRIARLRGGMYLLLRRLTVILLRVWLMRMVRTVLMSSCLLLRGLTWMLLLVLTLLLMLLRRLLLGVVAVMPAPAGRRRGAGDAARDGEAADDEARRGRAELHLLGVDETRCFDA